MKDLSTLRNSQIIVLGLCIATATIVSTVIFSRGLMAIKKFTDQAITVTGSAEKDIVSDFSVWQCEFTRRSQVLTEAYTQLGEDLKIVRTYLETLGFAPEDILPAQVQTQLVYQKNDKGYDTNAVEYYQLRQSIEVRSKDVAKIRHASSASTELIHQGIQFVSQSPQYFYTKLADLKLEMLSLATENAKQRAQNMAASTSNKIGLMRSARMGVFQITPIHSFEISDWGTNDTSSFEKKVTAVVNVTFSIAG